MSPADFERTLHAELDDVLPEALAALRQGLRSTDPSVSLRSAREIMRTFCTLVRHNRPARLGPRKTIVIHVHAAPPATQTALESRKPTSGD